MKLLYIVILFWLLFYSGLNAQSLNTTPYISKNSRICNIIDSVTLKKEIFVIKENKIEYNYFQIEDSSCMDIILYSFRFDTLKIDSSLVSTCLPLIALEIVQKKLLNNKIKYLNIIQPMFWKVVGKNEIIQEYKMYRSTCLYLFGNSKMENKRTQFSIIKINETPRVDCNQCLYIPIKLF